MDALHFSVEGEFLTEMARDFFVEDTPLKATNFLTESLHGMSQKQAISVITGKQKLTGINELSIENDSVSEKYGIPLSFESVWNRLGKKYLEEVSYLQMLKKRIDTVGRMIDSTGQCYRTCGIENKDTNQIFYFDADRKQYIKRKANLGELTKELLSIFDKTYCGLIGTKKTDTRNLEDIVDNSNRVWMLNQRLKDVNIPSVDDFLEAQRKIDDKLSKKITPNPIEDINDAGWLSPSGDWYGLDGEISNMLHNTIANALLDAGIIPVEHEDNPDFWLSKTGWARVHGEKVTFEGYQQFRLGGKRIKMTEIQQSKLSNYAKLRYLKHGTAHLALGTSGFCRVQRHLVSGVRFEILSDEQLEELFD